MNEANSPDLETLQRLERTAADLLAEVRKIGRAVYGPSFEISSSVGPGARRDPNSISSRIVAWLDDRSARAFTVREVRVVFPKPDGVMRSMLKGLADAKRIRRAGRGLFASLSFAGSTANAAQEEGAA
jgi:hypothetical protein